MGGAEGVASRFGGRQPADPPSRTPLQVLEETGVRARARAVLALRQAHGFAFGASDFFFVVALEPEPGEAEKALVPQEDEVDAAK